MPTCLAALPCPPQFHHLLSQDPRHELIYFGLIVNASWRVGGSGLIAGCMQQGQADAWQPPTAEAAPSSTLQDAAWVPGAFEQQQRAAGLNAYNGNPGGRDKNVHLR